MSCRAGRLDRIDESDEVEHVVVEEAAHTPMVSFGSSRSVADAIADRPVS
jgi:hypothetical protein